MQKSRTWDKIVGLHVLESKDLALSVGLRAIAVLRRVAGLIFQTDVMVVLEVATTMNVLQGQVSD